MTVRILRQLRWKPLAIAAAVSIVIYLPIIALDSDNGAILYWLAILLFTFGCLAVAFTLTLTGKWRDALTLIGVAFVCLFVSIALFSRSYFLRTYYRWVFHANTYKARLLAEHPVSSGKLTYMEWDSWGFAGDDTTVYLVHDPGDRLKHTMRTKSGMQGEGLPCEVWNIRRFEKEWYSVVFFTDENWSSCGSGQ